MLPTLAAAIWCQTLSYRLFAVRRPWSARSSGWRPDYPATRTSIWMPLGALQATFAGYLIIGIDRKQRDVTHSLIDPKAYFNEEA